MNGKYTILKGSCEFMSGVRSPSALRPFPYYLTLLSPDSGVLYMFFWVRTVISGNTIFLSEISFTSTESLGRPHGVQKPIGLHLGCKPCRSGTESHPIMALCNLKKQKQSVRSRSALLGHWLISKKLGAASPSVTAREGGCRGRGKNGTFPLLHTTWCLPLLSSVSVRIKEEGI